MTAPSESKATGERWVPWLLLIVAVALSVVVVRRTTAGGHTAREPGTVDPISAVPAGPELLLTADVAALGESLGRELFELGGAQLLGLRETCGFEPWLGLRRVALALPPRESAQISADFALIAETSLEPERVLRCAEAVITKRGGKPVRSQLGTLRSVRDQRRPSGEVAVRGDGLFVLSGGSYLRAVIDAAGGKHAGDEAAQVRTRLHAAIRGKLGAAQVALTVLPGALLALPDLKAVGVGLRVERDVELLGFIGCSSSSACQQVAGMLVQARGELAREPGLAPLGSIQLSEGDAQLELSGHLKRTELAPLIKALTAP